MELENLEEINQFKHKIVEIISNGEWEKVIKDQRLKTMYTILAISIDVHRFENSLTIEKALNSLGRKDLVKLIGYIIHNFNDSVKINPEKKMQPLEIHEASYMVVSQFKNEIVDDIILAFKWAKIHYEPYYGVGIHDCMKIMW